MLAAVQDAVRGVFVRHDIEEMILRNIQNRFTKIKEQKDPITGKAWAPLNEVTRSQRKRSKTGRRILVDTGSLAKSIRIGRTRMIDALFRGQGISIIGIRSGPSGSSPGFNVQDIARIHQFGENRIPKRRFLGVSKKEARDIETLFDVKIKASVNRVPGVRGTP